MDEQKLRLQYIRALLNFRLLTPGELTGEQTQVALNFFQTSNAFPYQVNKGLNAPIEEIKAYLSDYLTQQTEANEHTRSLIDVRD